MYKLSNRQIENQASIHLDMVGCKLNRYELELMRHQARELGLKPVKSPEEANVFLINTCSVTNEASRDSRQMIKKMRKHNEDAYIIVTGCYAQTDLNEVQSLGADLILNNFEKEQFFDLLRGEIRDFEGRVKIVETPLQETEQSRPFVKIQDGCNAFCSYCIIPRARGRSRNPKREVVLDKVRSLAHTHAEIVLSGVNLGQYEDGQGYGLLELLKDITAISQVQKIRISSIEPLDITKDFMNFVLKHPKICQHMHIPLQGLENSILDKMRRKYTLEEYRDKLLYLKAGNPDLCLGSDIMVGFPSESETIFETSLKNLHSLPLDYAHVFSFSEREKTVAATMDSELSSATKKDRNRQVTEWVRQRKELFLKSQLNRVIPAVVERQNEAKGFFQCMTDNYIPVIVEGEPGSKVLQAVQVKIDSISSTRAMGRVI